MNRTMLFVGIGLVVVFSLIFNSTAFYMKRIDFYSLFFNNILGHIPLTVLAGLHVGLLGIGILIIIVSFIYMTPEIRCYKDRFEISFFLQKKKIIMFSEIASITAKIYYLNYENLIRKYPKKECRVFFNNPVHDIFLCYPVKGYFDDIEIYQKKRREDLSRRCNVRRELIAELLTDLKNNYEINVPFLPEQTELRLSAK
jgi:hypothetical protein